MNTQHVHIHETYIRNQVTDVDSTKKGLPSRTRGSFFKIDETFRRVSSVAKNNHFVLNLNYRLRIRVPIS